MIDIHCHILPGLDDGSQSLAESIEMAQFLVSMGYKKVLASTHIKSGIYNNTAAIIQKKCETLQTALDARGIDLKIIPFVELYLDETVLNKIEAGVIPSYNNRILVEGPMNNWPDYLDSILFKIKTKGFSPILAHVERNRVLNRHPDRIRELKDDGVEIQVEALSIVSHYGESARSCVQELLKLDLVDYIATDLHGMPANPEIFSMAKAEIIQIVGENRWTELHGKKLEEEVLAWN